MTMGWVIFFAALIAIIWASAASANAVQKRKEEARSNYQRSLSDLKRNPANADLRQRTLELGRTYSNLMRDQKGNTVFDEVALMNDINAACAATLHVVSAPPSSNDLEERLRVLQGLKDKGLIDDAEYAKRKADILAQI
jgi:Flp pilus assembly protein TadB